MAVITTLNVIDNFFGDELPDFRSLSDEVIQDFGREIRRFSETYTPAQVKNEDTFPSFLGGWPSARWNDFSPLVMTSLLYSGQVLVKDILCDWFSDEQYKLPTGMPTSDNIVIARNYLGYQGYHNNQKDSDLTLRRNRYFLYKTLPVYLRARPLIESGILVLAPSRKFEYENRLKAEALATELLGRTVPSVSKFTQQFRPSDLPRGDLHRGGFLIMQSANKAIIEGQIIGGIREALYYLAVEYLLTQHFGFTYTATFPFEEYVCHSAITPALKTQTAGHRIYQGILNSKLPLYHNLTPEVVAQIRDDDSYSEFRRELYQVYATVPDQVSGAERRRHIREAEEALLRPQLEKIERNMKQGPLSRLGFSRFGVVRIAATVLTGLATIGLDPVTGVGTLGEVVQNFVQRNREKGSAVIWKKLYDHSRSVQTEFSDQKSKGEPRSKPYWGASLEDGLKATVTEMVYEDFPPEEW